MDRWIETKHLLYHYKASATILIGKDGSNKLKTQIKRLQEKQVNPPALRKAKIAYNFGLSECSRVK